MTLKEKIKALSKELHSQVIAWRKHLHANPELAFEEYETADFIASILKENGIEFKTGVAKTGVVGLVKGKNPNKKCIALRADMDALPIIESNTFAHTSKNIGKMHACGHDFHSASLLGTAIILEKHKNDFEGTIKLIFQPSEERLPGGASVMINEGVLENPKTEKIIGQHVSPELKTGIIGICSGKFMASADEIYLTVKGKGGHAAFPHNTVDPVIIAAQILVNLQQVVSRKTSPFDPAVLSFGKVIANGATNVIPYEVKIEGTFRAMNESFRKEAHQWIKSICESTAKSLGGSCETDIKVGYPCLENEPKFTEQVKQAATYFLDTQTVIDIPQRMGAEDFAYYTQKIPACFYRIGTGKNENTQHGQHTSSFEVDDEALLNSVGTMAWIAIETLTKVE